MMSTEMRHNQRPPRGLRLRGPSLRTAIAALALVCLAIPLQGQLNEKTTTADEFALEPRIQPLTEGIGWKLLRLYDETGADVYEDFYFITPAGIDNLVGFSEESKAELWEDFGVGLERSVLDEETTRRVILVHKEIHRGLEDTGTVPELYTRHASVQEGCFGWSDGTKTESWDFDAWSENQSFDLGGNVTGDLSVQLPISGEATLEARYRYKSAACIPYKFELRETRFYGNVNVLGDSLLNVTGSIGATWSKEWLLMNPKLGRVNFAIGPIPVWIDFRLPTYAGLDLGFELSGSVDFPTVFSAQGQFDYTCTSSTCVGGHTFGDSFDLGDVTTSVELTATARAWARMMLRAELYHSSIVFAEVGASGFAEAELWGYYGNRCGDADGDGKNETVRALALSGNAGYDFHANLGGLLVPDKEWTWKGGRYFLGWIDLLGSGGSTALAPMMVGPAVSTAGDGVEYEVSMRPCYPYPDKLDFTVNPGTWNGNMSVEPGSSDPTKNTSEVSRGFSLPGTRTLKVTSLGDNRGVGAGTIFTRTLDVLPKPVTVTFPTRSDAYISESWPTTNYGKTTQLKLRAAKTGTRNANAILMSFYVSGVSGPVTDVKLRLRNNAYLLKDVKVHKMCAGFSEYYVNYNNAPWGYACGELGHWFNLPAASWHTLALDQTIEFDNTLFIDGNGVYTIALVSEEEDLDWRRIFSRESSYPPTLEVTYQPE